MFIALSRFTVANGMTDRMKEAFRRRPHLVDGVAGFVRLDVLGPQDTPDEIWLLTYWEDEASFTPGTAAISIGRAIGACRGG
jgi:heme-degrading monooxygenase HmoA